VARGYGEVQRDLAVGRGKQTVQRSRHWDRVAVRQIEDQSVGQDSRGKAENSLTVAQSLLIERIVKKTPWI
jgi:hypothetical protein